MKEGGKDKNEQSKGEWRRVTKKGRAGVKDGGKDRRGSTQQGMMRNRNKENT